MLELTELGVNKLLAAFSRYEPRDLVDLAAITRRVPFARLLELAPNKDAGFDPAVLAHALRVTASRSLTEWGVDPAAHARVLEAVHEWQHTLEGRTLRREEPDIGPELER